MNEGMCDIETQHSWFSLVGVECRGMVSIDFRLGPLKEVFQTLVTAFLPSLLLPLFWGDALVSGSRPMLPKVTITIELLKGLATGTEEAHGAVFLVLPCPPLLRCWIVGIRLVTTER